MEVGGLEMGCGEDRVGHTRLPMTRLLHPFALACAAFILLERSSEGAASGAEVDLARARSYWPFQPVVSLPVPETRNARFRVQNPVDVFVLARLQEKGLDPA